MSSNMFPSPLKRDESGRQSSSMIRQLNMSIAKPDSDKIEIIFEDMYKRSKEEILKVIANLDIMYGSNSDEKAKGFNDLHKHLMDHLNSFFKDVVLESDRDKTNLIKEIEELLAEKETLEKELQTKIHIDERNDDTPLIDVQISIDKTLTECRIIKKERMADLISIQNEEKCICSLLGENPKYSEVTVVPSAAELETMKHHIVDLKNIQIERTSTFLEQKTKVESLFEDLGELPIFQFDKKVLGDPKNFVLSKSNLDELQKLIQRLEDQTTNQKCIATELRTKLNSLWDRLLIDVTHREQFVRSVKGFSKSVINELKMEVQKCETLKRENVKQFIDKLRAELDDIWDRCQFGVRQRKQCHVFYNKEYNEDVMDLLDIEVENAKKFYDNNIAIYNLIGDRDRLWGKMLMMREQTTDPARLWQNRGGQLLKEEKERKVIQKELPKVEKELKFLLHEFEKKEGKPFLLKDERLLDVMERQWSEFKDPKKIVSTKSKVQTGIRPQTPQCNKRKLATATSSNHASKVTPQSRLLRQNSNVATLVPLNSTKLIGVNQTSSSKQHTPFQEFNDENAASIESYANFQEHLETKKKQMLYTSPTTKSVLGEQNVYSSKAPRKALFRTPVKGSQIPIPTTPKTPIRTTPRTITRAATKLTRTINNKLPIIF